MRIALALSLLLAACATVPTQTRFMEEQGVKVSSDALRTRLRGEAIPFTGRMEEAADAVAAGTDDPAVRRRTIVWKLNVIPALYGALFHQRPLVALLDTWGLLLQAEGFLASPEGREAFGPTGAERMQATVAALETRVEAIAAWAAPGRDIAGVRKRLQAWADAHPVRISFATRDGVEEFLATLAPAEELGMMALAGRVNEDLDGLVARVDFLPILVPRQATWQAELTYLDLVDPRMDLAFARGSQALDKLDLMMTWLGSSGLDAFAREQRVQVGLALDAQRIELERLLDRQRLEVQAFVGRERAEIAAAVALERAAILADAQRVVDQAADVAARRAREVIDHAVWRLALLLGVVVAAFAVLGWALRRRGAPPSL
jgi:hypothetical protein